MNFKEIFIKNYSKILIILALFLIITLIVSFKLIMFVINKNTQCLGDPFVHNAQRLYDEGMEVICTCNPLDEKFNSFVFDRHNITINKEIGPRNINFNLSGLGIS